MTVISQCTGEENKPGTTADVLRGADTGCSVEKFSMTLCIAILFISLLLRLFL